MGDKWEVKANEYGLLFPHDFVFTSKNRETCEAEIQEQMGEFLAKYEFLSSRTIKAISDSSKLALLCNSAVSKEQYERLEALIINQFGKNEFTIFSFPDHKIAANQIFFGSRLITIGVSAIPWPGHIESWSNAFQAIDLSFASRREPE